MSKKAVTKYVIEAFLIVFSVLLALFLNKVFENRKVRQEEQTARESLVKELNHNLRVAHDMLRLHRKISTRLDSISNQDAGQLDQLFTNRSLNIGELLGGEPIMKEFLTSTSWETARSTGIISEFDYGDIETLTTVYALQHVVLDKTLAGIVDLLFKPESHEREHIHSTLLQLRLRFNELTGQEFILVESYKKAADQLQHPAR